MAVRKQTMVLVHKPAVSGAKWAVYWFG